MGTGGITVRSSRGTKVLKKFEIKIPVEEVDSIMECGFRQNWIDAENDKVKINLSCGAGLGSSWGCLIVKRNGVRREFRFDAEEIIRAIDEKTTEEGAAHLPWVDIIGGPAKKKVK